MLNIGIVGQFQTGKSLLINCLLGRPVATVGRRTATTHTIVKYQYSSDEHISVIESGLSQRDTLDNLGNYEVKDDVDEICVFLDNPLLLDYTLIDLPGLGNNAADNNKTLRALPGLDCAVLLASNDKVIGPLHTSFKDIIALKRFGVPYYFVLNCISHHDRWNPANEDNEDIASEDRDIMDFYPPMIYPFNKREVPIVNLMWYWYSLRGKEDSLIQKNISKLAGCGLLDEEVTDADIQEASNFHLIQQIFSMDNQLYLTIKKEFREELLRVKDEVCPIGTIQAFAFKDVPPGWLVCDGSLLKVSDFKSLYNVIGDTFGKGGDETFYLPDLRGQFVRGWDNSGKIDPGRVFGRSQNDTFQGHAHEVCLSSVKMKSSGNHDHDLYWANFTVRDASLNDINNHTQLMAIPYADSSAKLYNRVGNDYELKDGSSVEGEHTHELSIKEGMQPIGSPIESSFGPIKDHIGGETRPKNVALQYCIKAESLADICHSSKEELSTIKRDIALSVSRHLSPVSSLLPLSEMGSEEYNHWIDIIKKRFFSPVPKHHQDLILVTWRCFKEICIYNARIGHRIKGFDERGLFFLVSWMVDQGLVNTEDKLTFIDEIKNFALSLNSNLTPQEPSQ